MTRNTAACGGVCVKRTQQGLGFKKTAGCWRHDTTGKRALRTMPLYSSAARGAAMTTLNCAHRQQRHGSAVLQLPATPMPIPCPSEV